MGEADQFDPILRDTSLEATRVYYESLRRMGPARRLKAAFQLSDRMRAVVEAGVRRRHPDYDEERVRLAAIRLRLGDALFREVYGGVEVEP
jgi:hypothetical protein